jgi:hypothetical protein
VTALPPSVCPVLHIVESPGSLNNRWQGLAGWWQVASDLVLAIALVWALPLSLAVVTGLLRLLWNAV